MKQINVAVIGSGSTYCPELVDGFIKAADSLRLNKLSLMDIDERKRTIVGGLCERMLKNANIDCEVIMTDSLDIALKDADFVVTQIRVGKLPARHLDETIPLKYDLIGQETTGIGGFFKALRTIPVMAEICKKIEEVCPKAWLVNFTNPSGIISEFVQNYTNVKNIGLCNVPINMVDDVKAAVGEKADITYVGLNHLSWITSVKVNGKQQLDRLFDEGFAPEVMANIKDDGFDIECLRAAGGFPSSYLQYYYNRIEKLRHLKESDESRAEVCMEIEEDLLKLYSDESVITKPALLDLRGGHKYSLAAVSLIDSIANDKKDVHIVNIKNNGALEFMDDDDIVEIAAIIGKDGAVPIPVDISGNRHIIGLMRIVKEYEKLTVDAGRLGDDKAALNALMLHPLVGDFENSRSCYEEMKQAHKEYLPQFFK
ncbi:MAG TPA: 6-phospho-beta-glucosidase [Oscillospiraceae bacterium]|nr:6-phospho-beta-glucosidase [Oscillospiraceae bacterium]